MFCIVLARVLSLLWQLKRFHKLIMGKVEIGIYFSVTADILKKVLLKCFWISPVPTLWILSKSLILIGCHGNRKTKFRKKIFKNFLLRSLKGDEAETFHKCSWHYPLHKFFFFLWLPMFFHCYDNLKFPYTYNGKSGNWHLFLCWCRYFDKSFTEMFLE